MDEANELGWRLVTKDEFWAAIGNQNVAPRPVGPWPTVQPPAAPVGCDAEFDGDTAAKRGRS